MRYIMIIEEPKNRQDNILLHPQTEDPWATDIKRLLSDPNLKVTIDFNNDAGCEQYSVVVIESSDTESDMGFWLISFPEEQGARNYIIKHSLATRFDGKRTDIRAWEIRMGNNTESQNYDNKEAT
jgi:hypothetical protein